MESNDDITKSGGVLTVPFDIESDDFHELKAIILNKTREQTSAQKRKIELLALKYQMEDYVEKEDGKIKSVGDFLRQCLNSLHIKQNRFAEYVGLKPSNLSKLLNGERPLNHELAIILGDLFGIDPMIWLEIQTKNELTKLKESKTKIYRLDDLVS